MHENDLLASLPSLFATDDPDVLVGSGPDDCAHVAVTSGQLAFSTDAFAEGSHFLSTDSPSAIAHKAIGASVSDLAASAIRPRWALVSLSLKRGLPPDWVGEFARGLAAATRRYGMSIIGGDVTAAAAGVFVSVTVAGVPFPGGPLLRSGGRPGDDIVVTGSLGGSLKGKHLAPEARVGEIEELLRFAAAREGETGRPGAAMDISDGLALDLSRLCRESGVGAVLEEECIPLSPAAHATAAESGNTPLHHALADGEDFELLLTLPPALWQAFSRHLAAGQAPPGLAPFTRIGRLTAGRELLLQGADGHLRPLVPEGYEHQW